MRTEGQRAILCLCTGWRMKGPKDVNHDGLGQNVVHDISIDVGQTEIAPGMTIRQTLVV